MIFVHFRLILTDLDQNNCVAGFDFNQNGEIAATVDMLGVCLVSDMNTDSYCFHMNLEMKNKSGKQKC